MNVLVDRSEARGAPVVVEQNPTHGNQVEDFGELFKVKVDFDDTLPRTPEFEQLYARFVGVACREEGLRAFAPEALRPRRRHAGAGRPLPGGNVQRGGRARARGERRA